MPLLMVKDIYMPKKDLLRKNKPCRGCGKKSTQTQSTQTQSTQQNYVNDAKRKR